MTDQKIISQFKLAERQRIQNNQMIGALVEDVQQLQQMATGLLAVARKLPGYDKAIKDLAKENEEAQAKAEAEAEEAAKALEVTDAEEVKPEKEVKVLDLGPQIGKSAIDQIEDAND